ncbi:MAG: biotin transporter BioY [Syntrophobacteraceae bacterium]|jgi:biotin transport system substrate-specific component|nr:biotin transporter BioY [Syntrophobacteraceae bacterium]
MSLPELNRMAHTSLMAALIAVGALIHLPIGPVPVVLQNLFVLLAGLLLGSRHGVASVLLYLLIGAMGIPIFAGGKGGIAHFLGPTGGYLLGFAAAAFIAGLISERFPRSLSADICAVAAGTVIIYLIGVPWLKTVTQMTWTKALTVGMIPFLPGDILKAAAAVLLARPARLVLWRQVQGGSA